MYGSNAVVDLMTSPMPASGRTVYSNMTYNTTSNCGFMELYAYQEWAAFQYSILTGSNATISQFQRRLVLMPNNNCQFYGAGSQGCLGSYCYVWIRGDRLVYPSFCVIWLHLFKNDCISPTPLRTKLLNTFFHELGHTQNLQHSSNCVWAYGDCSCAMGCASDRT